MSAHHTKPCRLQLNIPAVEHMLTLEVPESGPVEKRVHKVQIIMAQDRKCRRGQAKRGSVMASISSDHTQPYGAKLNLC